jgi:cell division control protein 7
MKKAATRTSSKRATPIPPKHKPPRPEKPVAESSDVWQPYTMKLRHLCRINPADEQLVKSVHKFRNDFPLLEDWYHIVSATGEGTFSTVYRAVDNYYHLCDKSWDWACNTPAFVEYCPEAGTKVEKRFVALKRIYSNTSPDRVATEIEMLRLLRYDLALSLVSSYRVDSDRLLFPSLHIIGSRIQSY